MTDVNFGCFEQMRKSAVVMKVSGHRSGKQMQQLQRTGKEEHLQKGVKQTNGECGMAGVERAPGTPLRWVRVICCAIITRARFFFCCRDRLSEY